jgi:hypothetical protein
MWWITFIDSRKLDKYGIINYYKDSQVQCMSPIYCEKKLLSDSGQFFLFEGGSVKKTGTQAVRASHDNMAKY